MLPDLFGVDLCSLYQSNKDIAVAVAGGAYPVGKFLIWSGTRMVGVGCAMTKWALTKAPPAPLAEAVAVLIDGIAEATAEKIYTTGEKGNVSVKDGLRSGRAIVVGDEVRLGNWGSEQAVPYEKSEKKAIKAAYDARLAEIKAGERDSLREAAALGN